MTATLLLLVWIALFLIMGALLGMNMYMVRLRLRLVDTAAL